MSQSLAANQNKKQIRRPKFGHDRNLAKPVNLELLLEHPKTIPVLVSLDRHGLLTNGMIQDLLFRDHRELNPTLKNEEAAMKRQADRLIIKLKDAELLERRMVQLVSKRGFPYAHGINVLSAKGAKILEAYYQRHGGQLRWTPSVLNLKPHTYAHSLEINRCFVALQRACWAQDITLHYWIDDRQLAQIERSQTRFESVPDAFFILEYNGQLFTHCLEADRGTESQYLITGNNDIRTKAENYGRFLRSGYALAPFFAELPTPIVLFYTTGGERRLTNMAKEIDAAGGKGSYWLSTADQLFADKNPHNFWHPIWNTPQGEIRSLLDRVRLTHLS